MEAMEEKVRMEKVEKGLSLLDTCLCCMEACRARILIAVACLSLALLWRLGVMERPKPPIEEVV